MVKGLIILAPGGLGNQLFALAAALLISENNSKRILLISDIKELVDKFRQNEYMESSQHKVQILYSRKMSLWLNKLSSRTLIMSRKFSNIDKFFVRKFPTVQIPWEFPYDLLKKPYSNFWVLRGYFQDKSLLDKLSTSSQQVLISLFDMEDIPDVIQGNDVPRIVGVHVRRGDYLSIPSYGALSISYFHKLISHYREDTNLVMVASDDPSILDQFIVMGSEILLDARTYNPLDTMKLLGKSDIFFMSNSTFSFWIGWLVNLRGGTVIKPNPWFKANEVPENYLLLDNFIEAPSEFEE